MPRTPAIGHGPRIPPAQGRPEQLDWRGWWLRHQDRYFALTAGEESRQTRALTEAGEVLRGLGSGLSDRWQTHRLEPEFTGSGLVLFDLMNPSMSTRLRDEGLLTLARWRELPPVITRDRLRQQVGPTRRSVLLAEGLSGRNPTPLGPREDDTYDAATHDLALGLQLFALTEPRQQVMAWNHLAVTLLDGAQYSMPEQVALAASIGVAAHRASSHREDVARLQLVEQLLPLAVDEDRPAAMRAVLVVSLARVLPEFAPASSVRARLSQLCCVLVQERDAEPMVRLGAVQALGLVVRSDQGDPNADLALLLDIAQRAPQVDLRPTAWIAVARVTAQLGWEDALVESKVAPALLKTLQGPHGTVRPWAALAMGIAAVEARALGHGAPLASFADTLAKELSRSGSKDLRAACALGLGLIGDASQLELVRREAFESRGRATWPEVWHALALFRDTTIADTMLALVREERTQPLTLEALGRALAHLDRHDARVAFVEATHDRPLPMQVAAAHALRWFPDVDTLDQLAHVALDPQLQEPVRLAALRSLGAWGDGHPSRLRQACLTQWNPLAPNPFDAWGLTR